VSKKVKIDYGFIPYYTHKQNLLIANNRSITALLFGIYPCRRCLSIWELKSDSTDHPEAWRCEDGRILFLCHNYEKAQQPHESFQLMPFYRTYSPACNSYHRIFENLSVFRKWIKSR
jgi:hypothetical protein